MFPLMKSTLFRDSPLIRLQKSVRIVWQNRFIGALVHQLQSLDHLIPMVHGNRPERLCGAIITQLLSGKEEIKLGLLSPTRDFNYVKDTVNGFLEIAKRDKTIGEEINIATQREITIGELARELIRQINPKARIVCEEERLRPEKSEVSRLLGSNEKIMHLTDWRPVYSLEEGLNETIGFFRKNMGKYKADIYNL
jgi:Nucleoside-diphosphate-sugar epimerases